MFIDKLTDAEANLIAKYFSPLGDIAWKPSLIAFPHFQTFPSRVHKVLHSCKTTLLIDAMQNLQGLYDSKGKEVSLPEVQFSVLMVVLFCCAPFSIYCCLCFFFLME